LFIYRNERGSQALQELFELGILINGALASIVPPPASRHLGIGCVFQGWRADKSIVLKRLGRIVECNLADVIAEGSNVSLLSYVDVDSGRFGGFGNTIVVLVHARVVG
jgi:hypothetical protein